MTIADGEPDADDFSDRLDAFFQGEVAPRARRGLSIGAGAEEVRRREDAEIKNFERELDKLLTEEEPAAPAARERRVYFQDGQDDFERICGEPTLTPYDKARQRVIEAEILRDVAKPGSDDFHEAMADLAEARRKLKIEQQRALDDGWRKLREIDEHRKGKGRDDYNTSRRSVREEPNARTREMTPDELKQHKLDKNAERQWKHTKRKAGWPEKKIEAELTAWWAKRKAKRACA